MVRRALLLLTLILSLVATLGSRVTAHDWSVWKYVPSVWKIYTDDGGQCSSVLVSAKGIYLTAAHCVTYYAYDEDGNERITGTAATVKIHTGVGKVLYINQADDLAVFQAAVSGLPMPIAVREPYVGQSVLLLGYGMDAVFLTPVPSWWMGRPWNVDPPRVASGAIAGMSGGPVVNTQGEVVGLVQSVWRAPYFPVSGLTELAAIKAAVKKFVR